MSVYRDRVGQRIGTLEVVGDHARSKRGAVIWKVLDHRTGRERYLKTYEIIRADRGLIASPTETTK